ncbi:hypothetical protein L6R29_25880 [Myxococcota bacterium]|nr:hypothetical protein [Myxococcota bacterium]
MSNEKNSPPSTHAAPSPPTTAPPPEKTTPRSLSQREVFGTLSMDALVLDRPFPSSPRRPLPRSSSPSLDAAPASTTPFSPSLDNADSPMVSTSPSLENADSPTTWITASLDHTRSPMISTSPSLDGTPAINTAYSPSLDNVPALYTSPSLESADATALSAPNSSSRSLSQREVFGTLSMDALQLDRPFPPPSQKRSPPKRQAPTPQQLHDALVSSPTPAPKNDDDTDERPFAYPSTTSQTSLPAADPNTPASASDTSNPDEASASLPPQTRSWPIFLGLGTILVLLLAFFLLRGRLF